MIEGGCFCGQIRYAIADGAHIVANCHCSMCRKISAAPFVTWMVVPTQSFEYLKGRPKVLQSSEKGTRYFCADCGTPLVCVIKSRPDEVDVTTGSLDQPGDFPPTLAVHEDTKLKWLSTTEK
jgi:hypothetical protein